MLLAKVVAIWKMNRALPAVCAALLLVKIGAAVHAALPSRYKTAARGIELRFMA